MLENNTLGHLCSELMDEIMDDDSDHLSRFLNGF